MSEKLRCIYRKDCYDVEFIQFGSRVNVSLWMGSTCLNTKTKKLHKAKRLIRYLIKWGYEEV